MQKITNTIAKNSDGTIQINFTIPYSIIKRAQGIAANELGKDIKIEGFRRGMAPLSMTLAKIPREKLLERSLAKILPQVLAEALKTHKIKPAIYPKFELVKAIDGQDWQLRAMTCELPTVFLGNYKQTLRGALAAKSIWVPSYGRKKKGKPKEPTLSREEKEQEVIKVLLNSIKLIIPKILAEQEVKTRLARLLERIEKLGLSLESYLSSIGKNIETLRTEYEKSAQDSISLELILQRIADEEKIEVTDKEIDAAISTSSLDRKLAEELKNPQQRKIIEGILRRRASLDYLVSLV